MARCLASEEFLFGGEPEWYDLSVNWGPNSLFESYFDKLERNVVDAVRRGWVLEKNCSQGLGNRYILNKDKSVIAPLLSVLALLRALRPLFPGT